MDVQTAAQRDRVGRAISRIGVIGAGTVAGVAGVLGSVIATALWCAPAMTPLIAGGTAVIGMGAAGFELAGELGLILASLLGLFSAMALYGRFRTYRSTSPRRCRRARHPLHRASVSLTTSP